MMDWVSTRIFRNDHVTSALACVHATLWCGDPAAPFHSRGKPISSVLYNVLLNFVGIYFIKTLAFILIREVS